MAALTRIKHLTSSGTTAPSNLLKTGEIAYTYGGGTQANNGGRVFIGTGSESGGIASSQEIIGGKYFTDLLDHVHGTATAGSALIVDNNLHVDQLNLGALALESSGGSGQVVTSIETSMPGSPTDAQLITAAALKTYIDAEVTAQDLDFQGDSGGALSIDLDSETLTIAGGTGLSTAGSGNTVTVNLDNTNVTAGTYGSATEIPILTVNAQGQITSANVANVATQLTVDADTGTQNVDLLSDDLQIVGTSNEIETSVAKANNEVTVTVGLPDDVTIGNDLTVTTDLDVGTGNFTVAGATGNTVIDGTLQVNGNVNLGNATSDEVVIAGNLTVQGTTTTVESTTITLDDPVIALADNTSSNTSDGLDRGVRFKWGTGSAVATGFFGFDIQSERFVFTKDETVTSDDFSSPWSDAEFGDIYGTGADLGNIKIGLTGDNEIDTVSGNLTIDSAGGTVTVDDNLDVTGTVTLTNDLAVTEGGTGNSSFTDNGVLYGDGSNALDVTAAATADGSILQADSGGAPAFSNIIDGGTF